MTQELPEGVEPSATAPAAIPEPAATPAATPATTNAPTPPVEAQLRREVNRMRTMIIASLVALAIVLVALGAALISVQSSVTKLSTQVTELSAAAAAAVEAGQQAQAQPQEQARPQPEPQPTALPDPPQIPDGIALPDGVDAAGAFLIGDTTPEDVVEVYVDYQCPYCQRWEDQIGTALAERALQPDSGLLLKQYNLAFLGEQNRNLDPPGASARAAAAAACVLHGEGQQVFSRFNTAVFAKADPAEPATQFTSDVLAGWAAELGVSDDTLACIEEGRYVPFVAISTQAGFGRGVQGTPTVVLNGRLVQDGFGDSELIGLIGQPS